MMRPDQDRNVMGYPPNMNYPPQQQQQQHHHLQQQQQQQQYQQQQQSPLHPSAYGVPHHQGYPYPQHDPNVGPIPGPNAYNQPSPLPGFAIHQPHPSYTIPNNDQFPPPLSSNTKAYNNVTSFAYHKTQVYQPLEPSLGVDDEGGTNFIRFMILLFVVLVGGLCGLTLLIWLVFGMEIPQFRVTYFLVPTFNINETTSQISAKWEGNVTVTNKNERLEVSFVMGKSSIFYQNHVMALDYIEPLDIGNNTNGIMQSSLATTPLLVSQIPEELFNDLVEDRRNGSILFSLRIGIGATFKTDSMWRKEKLKIFCEDLMVTFAGDTGIGVLTVGPGDQDNLHECLVFT